MEHDDQTDGTSNFHIASFSDWRKKRKRENSSKMRKCISKETSSRHLFDRVLSLHSRFNLHNDLCTFSKYLFTVGLNNGCIGYTKCCLKTKSTLTILDYYFIFWCFMPIVDFCFLYKAFIVQLYRMNISVRRIVCPNEQSVLNGRTTYEWQCIGQTQG